MAWYQDAVFYHIYPLGLTGAPRSNPGGEPVHRLLSLLPWVRHIRDIGGTALYIGPLFESVGHGYETTDYYTLDRRLGSNEDLKRFVGECHAAGLHVIFDGVFNHTGREFFAFRDLLEKRENSAYRDWYCNVDFHGNNSYNDGLRYDNWGGFDLLVKLNQRNEAVRDYICDVIRFWVSEFDVDGIRLDAADVLDFDFMRALRRTADSVKPDFWLMGEVIHGDYSRWVNGDMLHSVTNYALHKALYNGHNEHNYFEIAHTVNYLQRMGPMSLYNFADNHDVARIYTKLKNKAHYLPVHVLLYTLPGIPSVYYGSEFAVEGKKERDSDDSLRPALDLDALCGSPEKKAYAELHRALAHARAEEPALRYGSYTELVLQNRCFAFARDWEVRRAIAAVNCDDMPTELRLPSGGISEYRGVLSGECYSEENGQIRVYLQPNSGEVLLCGAAAEKGSDGRVPVKIPEPVQTEEPIQPERRITAVPVPDKCPEEMTVPELQAAILDRMARNGPVTDQMRRSVEENIWQNSLVNWIKSFR